MKRLLKKAIIVMFVLFAVCNNVSAESLLWIGDSWGNLGTFDVITGKANVIGNMGMRMSDIAFDPYGNLYGISGPYFDSLYSINKNTAAASFIGYLGTSVCSLVFDSDGTLYAANSSLYTINVATGRATRIGNGGFAYNSSGDLAFIGEQLFLSSISYTDNLVRLDTETGFGTLIGNIGFSGVVGLASDNNNDLYGLSWTSVLHINTETGVGTPLISYGGQGLGNVWGTAFSTESGGTAATPEPATILLLGSGLLGLGIFGRKFRNRNV